MWVAGQALAIHFLAEIEQLLFRQTPFHECAGVNAGRHVALDVEAVAAMAFALGMPEMVEAGAKQAGQRRKRADVAAQIATIHRVVPIGFDHHRHGVPAHIGAQALFNFQVARRTLFVVGRNGVDVSRGRRKRHVQALLAGVIQQFLQQEVRPLRTLTLNDGGQRVHPFAGFLTVQVRCGGARGAFWNC